MKRGILVPVIQTEDGGVLDGRLRVAKTLDGWRAGSHVDLAMV